MKFVITGTYFSNADGSSRAGIIRKYCKVGAAVELEPEPGNPHDPNAVAVHLIVTGWLRSRRLQIGYIKATTAERKSDAFQSREPVRGVVVSFHAPPGFDKPRVTIQV